MKTRILAFAGSTRRESLNKKLVSIAAQIARDQGAEVTQIDLKDFPMPLYDGDLEADQGLPESATRLFHLMTEHQHLAVAHRITMFELPLQDVSHDLHVMVGMFAEPLAWRNPVFVHDSQRAELNISRITVICERKGVKGLYPTVITKTTLSRRSQFFHRLSPVLNLDLFKTQIGSNYL